MTARIFSVLFLCSAAAGAAPVLLTHAASAYADQAGGALKAPEGVACTDNGYVVVADTGNRRLVQYTYAGGKFAGGKPLRFDELGSPVRVQVDRAGNLLSLDSRTRRIVRVGQEGGFAGFVEMKDVPPEKGFFPVAFKLDAAGSISVVDLASARLVVLDPQGRFERELPLPAGAIVSDVTVDAKGTTFVVDTQGGEIWSAPRGARAFALFSKKLREYLNYPAYLTSAGRGQLVVVDQNGNGLVLVGPDGSFQGRQLSIGWNDGLVYYPQQICVDAKGEVFVADRGNNRVQAFNVAK